VLADRYDGDVELTETGPEGSVFTVELPRAEGPGGDTATATDADPAPAAEPTD
jgi:hypothetical protein